MSKARPPAGAADVAFEVRDRRGDKRYTKDGRLKSSVYEAEMERLQEQLVLLQYWIQSQGLRVAVIFEGQILDIVPVAEAEVAQIGLLMAGAEGTA